MLGHRELDFDDYKAIVKRRIWWIIVPATVVPVLAYLVSLQMPNKYVSQTLVLVEQQKVPDSFVKPVVNDDLTSRLATMQEQILSRTRLQPLIEKFGLYKNDVGKVPMEELVDRIRKSINVIPVRPEVATRTGGLPGFYIAFMADSPRLAQQVCSEITSMFMSENLKAREQSAQGTTDFLRTQLDDAKRNLDEQDRKLADFKKKYIGQLPGQEQTNLTMLNTLNAQLEAVTQAVARAQQDKAYIESTLSQQLTSWQASQSSNTPQTLDQQLAQLQSQLIALEGRYTPDHPDVIKTKSQIDVVKKKLAEAAAAPQEAISKPSPNEPQQIQQQRLQLHLAEQAVSERMAEQQRLQKMIGSYQAKIQLSPAVEEQFKILTRDYQTAQKFYDDLLTKKTQSEMATNLERRQQGEQFRVMDPANLPERPASPNRPLFALGGLLGGFVLGFGIALLLEMQDKAIRTERDVEFYLQLPVLALMPVVGPSNGGSGTRLRLRWRASKPTTRRVMGGVGSHV